MATQEVRRLLGAGILVVGVVLLVVSAVTALGIARDPSARLRPLETPVQISQSGPMASFTWNSTGYSVSVHDTSVDNGSSLTSWSWAWGDGTSAVGQAPPSHTYNTTCGRCTQTVTLVVTDALGRHSAVNGTVQIQANGTSQGSASANNPFHAVPRFGGIETALGPAIELLLILFLIGATVTRAGYRLLLREPETVDVPVRRPTPDG